MFFKLLLLEHIEERNISSIEVTVSPRYAVPIVEKDISRGQNLANNRESASFVVAVMQHSL